MVNREKVIKGLQCIIDGTVRCESCGYAIDKHGHYSCKQECAKDAIALLKEQEWNLLEEDDDGIIHGLPGDDGQYFMTDGKDIWIDDYVDGVADGIILDSGRDIREITAWMYKPELPNQNRR